VKRQTRAVLTMPFVLLGGAVVALQGWIQFPLQNIRWIDVAIAVGIGLLWTDWLEREKPDAK
jgi:hypothetical protein